MYRFTVGLLEQHYFDTRHQIAPRYKIQRCAPALIHSVLGTRCSLVVVECMERHLCLFYDLFLLISCALVYCLHVRLCESDGPPEKRRYRQL